MLRGLAKLNDEDAVEEVTNVISARMLAGVGGNASTSRACERTEAPMFSSCSSAPDTMPRS